MRITYKYKFNKSRKQQFIKMIAAILLVLVALVLALPEHAESKQSLNIGVAMSDNVEAAKTAGPRQLIIKYANIYGVDPALAISISRLETGNWTSEAYITKNNFGGLTVNGSVLSFENKEVGASRYIANLFETYIMNGLTSPETIGPIYCPPNADAWVRQVNKILDEERKEELKW